MGDQPRVISVPPEKPAITFTKCGEYICLDDYDSRQLVLYMIRIDRWAQDTYTLCGGD